MDIQNTPFHLLLCSFHYTFQIWRLLYQPIVTKGLILLAWWSYVRADRKCTYTILIISDLKLEMMWLILHYRIEHEIVQRPVATVWIPLCRWMSETRTKDLLTSTQVNARHVSIAATFCDLRRMRCLGKLGTQKELGPKYISRSFTKKLRPSFTLRGGVGAGLWGGGWNRQWRCGLHGLISG